MSCRASPGRRRLSSVLKSPVCGPCWAAHGGKPTAGEVGPAPAETTPVAYVSGQAEWLRELTGQDWVQDIRADGQSNLLAVARTVAAWADWDTLESRPTWEVLMRASGRSARSVARWLLELRLRGWIELIEHGTTPATRPMTLAALEGNRAAVYALRLPLTPERSAAVAAELGFTELASDPGCLGSSRAARADHAEQAPDQAELSVVKINGTPSWSCRSLVERSTSGFSRARKPVDNFSKNAPDQGKQKMTALRAGSDEQRFADLLIMVPVTRYEMLACADELRRRVPAVFGRCSRRLVRALCRPYWRAGWCGRDMLHALDHRPSMFGQVSRELGMPAELVSPRQLILGRLRAWQDDRGRIRPGYWTSRTRPAQMSGVAAAEASARELVRKWHGRAGARLLRAGETQLTVERITAHGQAVRRSPLRPTAGAPDKPLPAGAETAGAQDRAARAEFRARLLIQARAEIARNTSGSDTTAGQAWSPGPAERPASAYERALVRARAEGRIPRRRRA